MRWLTNVAHEIFGLFVDDGSFAVAILAWLCVAFLLAPQIGVPAAVKGPILFVGLAVILVESAVRRAGQ